MSNHTSKSNGLVYFIIGAVTVAFIGAGIYYFGGYAKQDQADLSITVGENGIDVDSN